MRIEFKFMPGPFQSYYEFEGVRERIRFGGGFYWNFNRCIYRTCASNYPKIYCDDIFHGEVEVASHSGRLLSRPPFTWNVVDVNGRKWQMIETWRASGWWADWKSIDGKRIMSFRRKSCSKGTAVIRSDWSENVGLLVGMVIPLCLSTG